MKKYQSKPSFQRKWDLSYVVPRSTNVHKANLRDGAILLSHRLSFYVFPRSGSYERKASFIYARKAN